MTNAMKLVAERDEFVGRRAELEWLRRHFSTGTRLCSILGIGGSGKTRLALHFAHELTRSESASVALCYASVAHARSDLELLEAVAHALDVTLPERGTAASHAEHVGDVLRGRARTLLILDNFEQLVTAAGHVLEVWLDRAPELTLLVTSRQRLRIRGEHGLELGPLDAADALDLFLTRARAVRRDLRPGSELDPVFPEIVKKLEGLPLAIELCAARSGALDPVQLFERLERRFDMLVARGVREPRQASLRAALEWSFQLLDSEEQSVLGQCCVFRGGFGLAAAEAILDCRRPVLDVLEALIDKSLLVASDAPGGERRYALLDSVRELCEETISPDERETSERRHARHYLELSAKWSVLAIEKSSRRSLLELELESQNLLAIHARAIRREAKEESLLAALALEPVFGRRGPLASFVSLLDRAFDSPGKDPPDELVRRGFFARGLAKFRSGDYQNAVHDFARASRASSDAIAAYARTRISVVHTVRGEYAEAERILAEVDAFYPTHENAFVGGKIEAAWAFLRWNEGKMEEARAHSLASRELFHRAGARGEEGIALSILGYVYLEQGALREAEDHIEASLVILRDVADRLNEAHALSYLVGLRIEQGRHDDATALLDRAFDLLRSSGDAHALGVVYGYAGQNELERGALDAAREHFRASVELLSKVGDRRWAANFSAALSAVEALSGRMQRAREIFDALEVGVSPVEKCVMAGWRAVRDAADAVASARSGDAERAGALAHDARAFLTTLPEAKPTELRMVVRVLTNVLAKLSVRRLCAAPDASWFEFDGRRVSLARRGNLRRILLSLLRARNEKTQSTLDVMELFRAGWPGEQVRIDSATHRVHVAIGTLRKLGLSDALVTTSDGYALEPSILVELLLPQGPT